MIFYMRIVFYLMLMVSKCLTKRQEQEPACYSRFDFEEKLLEKTIRMEHKMEVLEESVADKLKELDEKVLQMKGKLDSFGKPNVGFQITGLKNLSPVVGETLIFTKPVFNSFGAYNTDTGIFTVPVAGLYWFTAQICSYSHRGVQFKIFMNKTALTNTVQYGPVATCSSASAVYEVTVGDEISVQIPYIISTGQVLYENVHRECMFSGALVN